ncbi:MAG TPA: PD-(D/E)XK nuclease family protein [Thermoplasmatales archaeon]|nr:PD-(D/E)XK nuclease family protein [Thermoplasmatales archaeon]
MNYSYSAISSFESCPLKFKLAHIDRIAPPRKNIEAFLGSRVHETLEKLYRDKLYEKVCSLNELIDFYNKRWFKEMSGNIFVAKDYDIENYRKMGERYIKDYYNTYKPFEEGRTIALEKKVFFPLNEKYWLVGIIDRISEVDDIYEVHDYKTSLYLPSKKEMENDCQLALYALAVDYLYGIKDIELVWHFLAFNKEIRVKKKSYEDAKEEIIGRIEVIEKAIKENDFPPKESSLCPYCSYQPLCPLFKHEYKINEMEAEEATHEEGFELVNKYWLLTQKINELEKEKEEIKNKIVNYAIKNNLQYVYGSDKIANVKIYHNIVFNQKEYLENLLKKEGIYEKYARLDAIKLAEDFKKKLLPEKVMDLLKKFAEEKDVVKIYLRKARREE